MYNGNENITICDHPLIKHKITMLRMKTTGTNEFRALVEEIAVLMGYEALRGLEIEEIDVETPIGHIGMYRDEVTHEPHEYYCKLPNPIDQRKIFVVDPMLATGGSAVDAINLIKEKGGKDITFMCLIAAPEGLKRLSEEHPDVKIFVGNLDRELNENAYICPGLGDAGDRIFGTK